MLLNFLLIIKLNSQIPHSVVLICVKRNAIFSDSDRLWYSKFVRSRVSVCCQLSFFSKHGNKVSVPGDLLSAVISGFDFFVSRSLSLSLFGNVLNIHALFCVVSRIFYRHLSLFFLCTCLGGRCFVKTDDEKRLHGFSERCLHSSHSAVKHFSSEQMP